MRAVAIHFAALIGLEYVLEPTQAEGDAIIASGEFAARRTTAEDDPYPYRPPTLQRTIPDQVYCAGRAILEPNMPLVPSVRHVGSEFDVPGARVLGDGAGCEQTVVRESTSEARHRSPAFSCLR